MSTSVAACPITDSASDCYTASWYLIADQVRYWGLFQVPILALSIVYEWLELANDTRLERLRTLFDRPMINVANYIFQVVTCVYVCVAWVVRGGALSVSFSSWSIESFLLIITGVGYGIRWISAKHKVRFTIQLHSVLDLLSLMSHFTISFQTFAGSDGRLRRSWLDFGFLRSYILYIVIDHLFTRFKHKTFATQVLLVVFKAWMLVFFAACVLFSLERLGDLPYTNSFLLHAYKCFNADGSNYILVSNGTGTSDFSDCSETWSVFSSIYFMFVTVSTVGYGDFSPKTVLGQLLVCVIIVVGIYTFANESAALFRIYGDQRGGRVRYNVSRNTAHVIVTGNPSAAQMKDFIREFFHPDHDAMFEAAAQKGDEDMDNDDDEDDDHGLLSRRSRSSRRGTVDHALEEGRNGILQRKKRVDGVSQRSHGNADADADVEGAGALATKWMQRKGAYHVRETHIVVLMRFDDDSGGFSSSSSGGSASDGNEGVSASFQEEVMQFVNDNPRYQKRVFLIYGSPLKSKDLEHAHVQQAMAVFFLPNKFSNDGTREDAATVLRVLAVSQQVNREETQLFAMLVNSENRTLLEATGLSSENLVCADELRLGLMGLSCRCPGLSTLVSNLITSRSGELPIDANIAGLVKPWIREYVTGAGNEIYSCVLADFLQGMTFTQCTQRIHRQSDGQVLLIAVEHEKQTHFNPGHWFRIPHRCRAFVIAESMTALAPFAAASSVSSAAATSTTTAPTATSKITTKEKTDPLQQCHLRSRDPQVSATIERKMIARARQAQHNVERRLPQHVRDHVLRCGGGERLASFQAAPSHPPPQLIAQGGHIVVCSNVGNEGASSGSRSISRLVSFLRPLRAPHVERVVPVVIVDAETFDGVAWMQLSEFGDVYHVIGSPQKHHVLVAAGVYSASAIVVLAQGTAEGYDDSKAIFNAILVNAALQQSDIFTIIELRDVHNNKFLDPVPSFSSYQSHQSQTRGTGRAALEYLDDAAHTQGRSPVGSVLSSSSAAVSSPHRAFASHRVSSLSRHSQHGVTMHRDSMGRAASMASAPPQKRTWWDLQTSNARKAAFYVREFFWGSLYNAASRLQGDATTITVEEATAAVLETLVRGDDDNDTFFQERFMRGALFPSYVADDLLIQSFFNPSLNEFIRKILDGTSCFMLYDLPKQWRHGTQTYGELFDAMTSGIASALPIGLLRAKAGDTGAPHAYVYTSPSTSTVLHPEDKVFVIIDVTSLHRVANKLQRRFRSAKTLKKQTQWPATTTSDGGSGGPSSA